MQKSDDDADERCLLVIHSFCMPITIGDQTIPCISYGLKKNSYIYAKNICELMYRNTQLRNNYFRYFQTTKKPTLSLYKWEALAIGIVWVGGVLWSNAMKEKYHNMPIQE